MADSDIQYLIGTDPEKIYHSSALYLLKLKEHYKIPQVALDYIVEGTRSLLNQTNRCVEASIKSQLADSGMEIDELRFKDAIDPFHGIDTCFLQEKYYREKLGLIVS